MRKIIYSLIFYTLVASYAHAGKVMNLDNEARSFEIVYLGGETEKVTLAPSHSFYFYGVGNELKHYGFSTMVADPRDEYVISNNRLYIHRRGDRITGRH